MQLFLSARGARKLRRGTLKLQSLRSPARANARAFDPGDKRSHSAARGALEAARSSKPTTTTTSLEPLLILTAPNAAESERTYAPYFMHASAGARAHAKELIGGGLYFNHSLHGCSDSLSLVFLFFLALCLLTPPTRVHIYGFICIRPEQSWIFMAPF